MEIFVCPMDTPRADRLHSSPAWRASTSRKKNLFLKKNKISFKKNQLFLQEIYSFNEKIIGERQAMCPKTGMGAF